MFSEVERWALVSYLAANPMARDLIPGTSGVRKLRWAREGRGKRGGARVIYFHHGRDLPIFVLAAYGKTERADISAKDRNAYKALTKLLVESYRSRSHVRSRR